MSSVAPTRARWSSRRFAGDAGRARDARATRRRARDLNAAPATRARDGDGDGDGAALDFNACAREHARAFRATPMSARLTREFGIGDSGTDVSLAQRLLGRDARRAHGVCDRETTEALRAWQISRGLKPSGFFGASSRAQMAMEEERWRELGGGALLERLWEEEARARDASERANERAGGSGRTRGVVATSTTPREAPRVSRVARGALVLVVASAALGAAAHLRNRERFAAFVDSATAWTRESRAKVALDVAREFVGACGARAGPRSPQISPSGAERSSAPPRRRFLAFDPRRNASRRTTRSTPAHRSRRDTSMKTVAGGSPHCPRPRPKPPTRGRVPPSRLREAERRRLASAPSKCASAGSTSVANRSTSARTSVKRLSASLNFSATPNERARAISMYTHSSPSIRSVAAPPPRPHSTTPCSV